MYKELLLETMRKPYLELFQKDAKKFLTNRLVLGIVMAIMVYFVFGEDFGTVGKIVLTSASFIAGFKIPYWQLLVMKDNHEMMKTFLFPQFLRFFIALYSTHGNVYQTLIASAKYVDEPMQSRILEFIEDIGESNDYDHYVDFADYVGTNEAQVVMSIIYNFTERGVVKEELEELERASKKILANKFEEAVIIKARKQEEFINYVVFLSIGYLLVFVFATILGLIQTLGFGLA